MPEKKQYWKSIDTQEQIDVCLNCPYPDCRASCIPGVYMPPVARYASRALDNNGFGLDLIKRGLTDKEIAAIVGATSSAIGHWRRTRGYPSGTKMRKEKKRCSA